MGQLCLYAAMPSSKRNYPAFSGRSRRGRRVRGSAKITYILVVILPSMRNVSIVDSVRLPSAHRIFRLFLRCCHFRSFTYSSSQVLACYSYMNFIYTQSLPRTLSLRDDVIHHASRDIHTRCIDAVAELHCVIDFVDREAICCFEQVNRQ